MADSTPAGPKHGPVKTIPSTEGAGAAATRAPEAPLRVDASQGVGARRSVRITLTVPVEVSGTDLAGHSFTESCHTEQVSLHGGSVVLSRRTSPAQPMTVRRRVLDSEVRARVLGQLGIRTGSHVYGIAFTADAPDFWGVFFPPLGGAEDALARTFLQCSQCQKKAIFALNEIEYRVFEVNQRISHACEACGRPVPWIPVPNEAGTAAAGPEGANLGAPNPAGANSEDRKRATTKIRAMACIQEPGGGEDVVQALDLSRGGITFRASRAYEVNTWINLAVPYMPGAANIFVAGRIASRKDLPDGQFEYAVQYVKG